MHSTKRATAFPLMLVLASVVCSARASRIPAPATNSNADSTVTRWCGERATYDDLTSMLKEPFGKINGGAAPVELTIFSIQKFHAYPSPDGLVHDDDCVGRTSISRVQVSTAGEVWYFSMQFGAFSGGGMGGGQLDAADLTLLKLLTGNLPDDDHHVPPLEDRVIVSVVRDSTVTVRLYDRRRLPDEIAEMTRITGFRITLPEHVFAPLHSWTQSEAQQAGVVPGPSAGTWTRNVGRTLAVNANGSMFTAEDFDKENLHIYRITGDASAPELVHTISESPDGRRRIYATNTYFSPDGQLLMVISNRPEIRLFNTSTWQPLTDASLIPPGAIGFTPSADWKLGLAEMGANQALLWDCGKHRTISSLKLDGPLSWAVFSQDDRALTFATAVAGGQPSKLLRLSTEAGDELPELWPPAWHSKITEPPLWWGNGRFLIAAWWSGDTGTGGLSLWDSSTGRLLGTLEDRATVPVLQGNSLLSFRSVLPNDPGGVKEWTLDDVLRSTAQREAASRPPEKNQP
jgi:WD40 repeat protein